MASDVLGTTEWVADHLNDKKVKLIEVDATPLPMLAGAFGVIAVPVVIGLALDARAINEILQASF